MSVVIACRDSKWVCRKTDFRHWDQVCRAFGAILQMVDTLDQAVIPEGYVVIALDETGTERLQDFRHPENAVYVFGRSGQDRIQDEIRCDHSVRIETARPIPLFGITAVGIVLHDRMGKWL